MTMATALNIETYEDKLGETMLQHGCPKNMLWLVECELCDDGQAGVVYFHESGNLYDVHQFTDDESFGEACKAVAQGARAFHCYADDSWEQRLASANID